MSAAVPLFLSQSVSALTSVSISNPTDLCNAIENQADNQIWTINSGTYGLTQCNDILAGGQTGWYFPITHNNITIVGINNPTIYGDGYSANGNWASQDLIAIFGNNVTLNGLTLMPKVEPNKTIEVIGDSATIENVTITPNTLTDQSNYNKISDPSDSAWAQDAKTFGGSIYYNNATGVQTLDNVSIINGGVSVHAPAATLNATTLRISYASNVDWINDYRFYVASPTSLINGVPTYTYHVNATLNNFDSVLAAVGDPTTVVGTDMISLDSNLTTSKQVTLTKPVTLNGNGHTINPTFLKTDNSNNSALGVLGDNITLNNLVEDGTGSTNLHGINAYMANGINLNDVTLKNNGHDGLAVNGSNVTVNNLTTSGNTWGGVDVDQGSGVTTPAVLTITGHSTQTESGADVLVDNINNKNVTVNDPGNQYSYATYGIMGVYKLKLATPTNLTPVDGTYTNNPAFVNTWSSVADATGYEYRTSDTMNGNVLGSVIYSDSNLTQPGRYSINGSTENRQNGGTPQGTYYWQVRATGANGKVSDWSQINKVVVDTTAPSMPALTAPSNNGFETTNDFYFTWSNSADTGTPVTYEFQSDNNGSFTSPWDSITNGNSEQNNLTTPQIHSTGAPDGTYYWRVRAIDASGNKSAWTASWKMTIDTAAPAPVATTSIKPYYTKLGTSTKTLSWTTSASSDVDHYEYAEYYNTSPATSSTTPDWLKIVNGTSTTDTAWQSNVSIYWRVRAVDHAGNKSAWSDIGQIISDVNAPNSTNNLPSIFHGTVDVNQIITDNIAPASGKLRIWKLDSNGVQDNTKFFAIGDVAVDGNNSVTYKLDTLANLYGDGKYVAKFTATDKAGNQSVVQQNFIVDNTAPTLTTLGYIGTNTTPTIKGTTTSSTDIVTVDGNTATVDSSANNAGTYDWSYILPLQSIGAHSFSVVSIDLVGNATSPATVGVTIESTPALLTTPTATTQNTVTPQAVDNTVGAPAVLGATTDTTQTPAADALGTPDVKGASTQLATTVTPSSSSTGLAWYWWVLIVAGVASFGWWLIARLRNRSNVA
jgi:hypothetical protein